MRHSTYENGKKSENFENKKKIAIEVEVKASPEEFFISTKEVEVNVHEGDFHGSHIVKLTYQFVHQVIGWQMEMKTDISWLILVVWLNVCERLLDTWLENGKSHLRLLEKSLFESLIYCQITWSTKKAFWALMEISCFLYRTKI